MLHVVLPRPDQLDRGLCLLGDAQRLDDKIHFEAPAESAAQVGEIDLDRLGREAGDFCGGPVDEGDGLGADPDLAAIRLEIHGAVHRLHGGVGDKGRVVLRFNGLVRLFQAGVDVPVPAGDRGAL